MFKLPFGKIKIGKLSLRKSVVVVEIGNDWLKIAECVPSSSGGEITKLALQKLSQVKDDIPVAIGKIFKDLSLNGQSVILCIPRHLITVRVLELPSTDAKEISDMINLQVGRQTPYSKEEIVSAHKILYSNREGYTKVTLAIAQRNIIDVRIEALKNAGVSVGKVSVSSEGVYDWFTLSYMPDIPAAKANVSETVAFLDVDSNYSDFIAIRGGKMVFTKNIFLGANHLAEASESWRDKLVEELERCFKRYYIEEKNTRITKLYLSGAARNMEDVDIILTNKLDIAVEKSDTFRNIRIKDAVRRAREQDMKLVSITALIGMAIKGADLSLDLTPAEQRILKLMERKRKELTMMGVLFAFLVMALSFLLVISFYYKNTYLAQLKKRAVEASGESEEVARMRMTIDLVKRSLDTRNSSLNILREIYKVVPAEIALNSIDIDENKQLVLKGRGFTMSDVFKFVKKLEESQLFASVKASYTRSRRERENDKDMEYVEFEIVCPYEKQ
ncbi:MAG: pilus assembly protein PilM [Candidatus Omnitrophota bacterium]